MAQSGDQLRSVFILKTARRGGALPVRTFDERLARASGAELA